MHYSSNKNDNHHHKSENKLSFETETKIKDNKDDTESGIDIPEPDYSPILVRRRNRQSKESIILYSPANSSIALHQKDGTDVDDSQQENIIHNHYKDPETESNLWENATRYRGSLEIILTGQNDEDVLEPIYQCKRLIAALEANSSPFIFYIS